ncbi:PLC-like phosphodiesterase [Hymenopellis radicata]|nr:PLC-like phosphodiesterase [Hymenopellis radicata]
MDVGKRELNETRLAEALDRGKGILGVYSDCPSTSKTCQWMSSYADDTMLVRMNLPGTHDAATWNYTQARQNELKRYTGDGIAEAKYYRCQEHSMFDMLNGGIRVFDWRIAYNPGNTQLGFHHSEAMLDPNATLSDVLYGFYYWLSVHPSEAVLISINHEGGTGTPNDQTLYEKMYQDLNDAAAKEFWVQANGTLGTLGDARGKLTLLQRFTWDLLPSSSEFSTRFGIALPPSQWTDNSPDIEIVYNTATTPNQAAFIEDYYEIGLPTGSGADENIQWKYNATTAHIDEAIDGKRGEDQLWISFASSEHNADNPPETPEIMALGNGSVQGVNQRLLSFLNTRQGGRFGVIMLDFFDTVPGLVEAIIGV